MESVRQFDYMREGVVLLDERDKFKGLPRQIWRICDARLSRKSANKFVADILARSRKRSLVYIFTAQVIDTIDKRIRKVMDFTSYCQPPDQEIICNPEIKMIKDIQVGDNVLTHMGRFQKVSKLMSRNYEGNLYTINPDKIKIPVKMTEEHPILVAETTFKRKYNVNKFWSIEDFKYITENFYSKPVREQAKELGMKEERLHNKRNIIRRKGIKFNLVWKKPNEIKNTDLIAYPIIQTTEDKDSIKLSDYYQERDFTNTWVLKKDFWKFERKKINDEIKIDNNFLKLMGYYIGDGSVCKNLKEGSIIISINKKHKDRIEEVKRLFKSVFNMEAKEKMNNKSAIDVYICCLPIAKMFKDLCEQGSENKHIPQWAMILPIEKQKYLLEGYLATDGHKLKSCGDHRFSAHNFCTVSKLLASQLIQIILRCGYKVHMEIQKPDNRRNPKVLGKLDSYHGYISKQKGTSFFHNGYYLMPIKEIKVEKYTGNVHNIEVENDNSYTSKSVCLHNCITNRRETVFKTMVFRSGYVRVGTYMKTFYYTAEVPMNCYDSNEEIDMEDDINEETPFPEPKIIWQEGIYRCRDCGFPSTMNTGKCNECESRNIEPIEPIYFDSWEAADTHASQFWEKWFTEHGYGLSKSLS